MMSINKSINVNRNSIHNGVMLNAYPDSIGKDLQDILSLQKKPEFKVVFSLYYVLPTFFISDLDRGFLINFKLNKISKNLNFNAQ